VRLGEQRADRRLVAGAQQSGGTQDALGLGHDVPGHAPQGRVVEPGQVPGVFDVSQGPDAQGGRGLLAGPAALRVPAVGHRAPDAGVDDQQGQAARGRVERDRRARPVAAVEQQRVAGLAQQGGGLVHDAGRHAGELVLGPPGQGGQLVPGHRYLIEAGQGQRDGAFERGRGREPGARGQVGVDRHLGAAGQVAGLSQRPGHPGRVGGPAGGLTRLERVDVQPHRLVRPLPRHQRDPAAGATGRGDGDPGIQRERQHEHLVVVRAAHQVDPAGREPDAVGRPAAVPFGEPGGRGRRRYHGGHRHCAAACCGSTGSKKRPAPNSAAARCRRVPGARSAGARCTCRWAAG
jgi:hypothetical protein